MNSQNNQQILLYNFVSLLRGVCILGYISKNLNKSYHHNDFIQTSKNWVKEHLIECQAIQNHIDAILNIIDNEWNSQQDIDFSLHNNLLEPIFQNVFKNFSNKNEGFPYTVNNITPRFYKLEVIQPLKETEYITSLKDNNPIQNIQNLYNQLEKEIKNLKNSDLSSLSFALYYLLYKYTLRIPCYIKGKEDVSLFDAIRVITAVKNCEWASYNKETPFLLIKGDVAGIQNYIYSDIELDKTGSTQGLSKKLRGRSFLVSLLTDYFASLFISEFQVFEPHILYSGGGHFLVLLPNLEDSESKLLKLEKEINLMLAKKLSFKLTFLLGKAYLDKSLLEDASNAILNVNHSLNKAKNQKHLAFIDEIFNLSLANQLNEENLGSLIPNSNFLIELQLKSSLEKNNANRDALITDFSEWNTYYFLVDNDNEIEKLLPSNKDNIKSVKIYAFNQTEFIRNFKSSFPIHYGFKIIANYVPKNSKDKALTFEEISSLELPQSQNSCLEYKQLGILRLDVDHLGSIFAYGLEKNGQTSLMRVATLSRELHHFFAGYSNVLTKKYHIYTVYSGGDDAFFIGSWINILHFANEFRKAFKNFVCNNPNLSFSAGIFMCHPRHPIAKFAEEAAEMEKLSKKFNHGQKDAITVFEHTLSWEKFSEMLNFSQKLLKYVDTNASANEKNTEKLARSFVHRILRMIKSSLHNKGQNEGQVDVEKLYKNAALLHYLLARRGFSQNEMDKNKNKEIVQDIIRILIDNFIKQEMIKNFLIPTNYVILKTRRIAKNK